MMTFTRHFLLAVPVSAFRSRFPTYPNKYDLNFHHYISQKSRQLLSESSNANEESFQLAVISYDTQTKIETTNQWQKQDHLHLNVHANAM